MLKEGLQQKEYDTSKNLDLYEAIKNNGNEMSEDKIIL